MTEDERQPDSEDDEGSEPSDPPQQDSNRSTGSDSRQEESSTRGEEADTQPGEGFGQRDTEQPDRSGFGEEGTEQPDESNVEQEDTGQPDQSSLRQEDTGQPDQSGFEQEDTGQSDQSGFGQDEQSGTRRGQENTGQSDRSGFGQDERSDTRRRQEPDTERPTGEAREQGARQSSAGMQGTGRSQAGAQGAGTGRPASTRGGPDASPRGGARQRQTQGPAQRGQTRGVAEAISERIRRFYTVIVWPESLIAGIGTWLVGFLLTILPLWWFDFGDETGESILDVTVWVYIESVGGTINGEALGVTTGVYRTLESNAFGLGPALHGFVPMLVLIVAGYILAGRHIKRGTAKRPLQSVLAGGSLAIWFTLTLFIAAVISSSGAFSVNLLETLVVTLLYTGVFASIGATIRSRTGLTSAWGLLVGIGAFLVGLLAWRFIDNPFEDRPGVDGITDLDGLLEYTRLLTGFVSEHGVGADEILPTWFAAVVPLLFGGVLALAYRRRDPVVGFGEGARLGTTYALIVFVAVVANIGAQAQEYEEQGATWSDRQIEFANQLIASAPRSILFAGVVYPVVFAAIGGAIGATVYDLWQSSSEESQQQTRQSRREPAGSATGGNRQGQGARASQQYRQSTGPGQQSRSGQQTPNRSGQRPPEGAGDGYSAGGQSPGRTDDQYRSGQQPSGRTDDQYQSGQQSPGRTDDQYRSGQQPLGRADDQYQSGQQSPGRTDDQYRSGQQPSGRTDDQYQSGQQSPGRTDDQYRSGQRGTEGSDDNYHSGRRRADRGESVDDTGRGEGRETESDNSGEELSPGDIVRDDLDEDDTGGS